MFVSICDCKLVGVFVYLFFHSFQSASICVHLRQKNLLFLFVSICYCKLAGVFVYLFFHSFQSAFICVHPRQKKS
ncbi:hypothetical protein AUK22_10990 [bacterium CG2_30_54_10]|nr:MAG: hypothetical protein AUK22_10990 [bacterium CG2_30_54_10]